MSKTINRIMEVIKHQNLSARQFDISIGAANGYTLRMQKNNASVGTDVVERIIKQYPKVNLVWLITGKGSMFITDSDSKVKSAKIDLDELIDEKTRSAWSQEKQTLLDEIINEINEQ